MRRTVLLLLVLVALSAVIGCGNKAPIINSFAPNPPEVDIVTEEVIHFSVNASDPDKNTTLTYAWVFTSGSPLSVQGAFVDWTAPDSPGSAKATVTVSDGKLNVTKTWDITVGIPPEKQVTVQLAKLADNTSYAVENMTVVLEDENGMQSFVKTNANGRVVFPLTEYGTYKIVRVAGLDVTGGVEGAVGLEFVKESPINTSAPKIAHVYADVDCPTATIFPGNEQVEIQSPIPAVRKVTIMKKGSVDTPDETKYIYNTAASCAGRLIINDRNCDCPGGLYVRSSGNPVNFMVFTLGAPTGIGTMTFYSGVAKTVELSNVGKVSDPLTIEIPGDGDWAFTSGAAVFTRTSNGVGNSTDSFTLFGRNSDLQVFETFNMSINRPAPDHYRFDYEFQVFETL